MLLALQSGHSALSVVSASSDTYPDLPVSPRVLDSDAPVNLESQLFIGQAHPEDADAHHHHFAPHQVSTCSHSIDYSHCFLILVLPFSWHSAMV